MKTFSHLWQCCAEFFLELQMFQIKVVKKIKILILCSVTFPRKSCRLWYNVEKYGGIKVATDNMAHVRYVWVGKATRACARAHTHTEILYAILIAFPWQEWFRECSSMLRYTYIACLVFVYSCVLLCDLKTPTMNAASNINHVPTETKHEYMKSFDSDKVM
jgi:hypothetical protein